MRDRILSGWQISALRAGVGIGPFIDPKPGSIFDSPAFAMACGGMDRFITDVLDGNTQAVPFKRLPAYAAARRRRSPPMAY